MNQTTDEIRLDTLRDQVTGPLARRYGTATVLVHHGVATHLGLGPADHKCLDLLLERGPMTASQLARITGLTSGALSGVVARLEGEGRIRRERDPEDGRRQLLSVRVEANHDLLSLFESIDIDREAMVRDLDHSQLEAIAQFLKAGTERSYQRLALLQSRALAGSDQPETEKGNP